MKNLILLSALLATSALADVSVKVNRIEASVIDNAEESANEVSVIDNAEESADEVTDTEAPARPVDHNASRSNNTRRSGDEAGTLKGSPTGSHRDAASGLPTGKRQHFLDPDSDSKTGQMAVTMIAILMLVPRRKTIIQVVQTDAE